MNFRRSASTVLDSNGYGTLRIAPSGKDWTIHYLSVRCDTHNEEARASVYENYVGADYLIDSTFTGSSGDTTNTEIRVREGYAIVVEWVGGDPGTTATVTYTGDET